MGVENITINHERIVSVVDTCLKAREERFGVYENPNVPETNYISLLQEVGQLIGDERFPLNAVFLTTSMVFAEDTEKQFKRISDLEKINNSSWIFQPEVASSSSATELAVSEFFNPGGYNNHSVKQWRHSCEILTNNYGGDIRLFFQANNDDAIKIINSLVVHPRKKDKEEFRRFGPKLSRLLIQWVNQYNLYPLTNSDQVGLPVDFNIMRILRQSEGIMFDEPQTAHDVGEKVLTPLLTNMAMDHDWNPREVSEALYLLGNRGCNTKRHDLCPIKDKCKMLIPRKPYDKAGLIDPTSAEKLVFSQ